MLKTRSSLPYLLAFIAAMFWSTVATAFKLALRGFSPIQLLLYASSTSLLILLIFNAIRFKGNPFVGIKNGIVLSAISGILNPFLYYMVLFKAYDLLLAQEAQPLNYTWPIALTLISIPIRRRKPSLWGLLGMVVSFSGVMFISTRGNPLSFRLSDPLGDSLALGSGLIWAAYWSVNADRGGDIAQNLMMNFIFGFPPLLLTALITDNLSPFPISSLAASIYSGIFEMGITFLVWNHALSSAVDVSRISNIAYLSPFFSLIFIGLILRERILWSSIVGLILIVGGILVQNLRR
ncbi:TPA: DMT family transporter [Candidatus Poribacteria bacterium]|nr:DMT family transporter [Candidatus Poribacteria bacterium]HEX29812.1 DMT family transporter [Candidatus Poribacteria bacterium]